MGKKRFKVSSTTLIFAAMIFGAVLGLVFGEKMSRFKFIGDIWLNCIKLIIVPLVMCIMIQAVGKQQDTKSLGRVAFRIVFYYIFTTVMAAVIGLLVASLVRPGDGLHMTETAAEAVETSGFTFESFFSSLFSDNLFGSFSGGNVLQTLVIAILFGLAVLNMKSGEHKKTVLDWIDGIYSMLITYIGGVIKLAPIGVLFLMADCFGKYGPSLLGSMAKVIGSVYLSIICQILLVYCVALFIFARITPWHFIKKSFPVWSFTAATGSSAATIPLNLKAAKDFGTPDHIADFCIPLGANINYDGSTLMICTVLMLIAQMNGIHYDIAALVKIVAVATLVSSSGGGIPGNIIVKMTVVAETIGLPLEIIGVIAGFYKIIEMGTTTCNCIGDLSGTICVGALEKKREQKLVEKAKNAGNGGAKRC